jgi:hypothetical protein
VAAGLSATSALVGFLVFGATTLGAIACLLLKIARPELVGLWIGPDVFVLGIATTHPAAPEMRATGSMWFWRRWCSSMPYWRALVLYSRSRA